MIILWSGLSDRERQR